MKSHPTFGDNNRIAIGTVIIGVLARSPTSLHHDHLKKGIGVRTPRPLR
jgi:hypothetical protein